VYFCVLFVPFFCWASSNILKNEEILSPSRQHTKSTLMQRQTVTPLPLFSFPVVFATQLHELLFISFNRGCTLSVSSVLVLPQLPLYPLVVLFFGPVFPLLGGCDQSAVGGGSLLSLCKRPRFPIGLKPNCYLWLAPSKFFSVLVVVWHPVGGSSPLREEGGILEAALLFSR